MNTSLNEEVYNAVVNALLTSSTQEEAYNKLKEIFYECEKTFDGKVTAAEIFYDLTGQRDSNTHLYAWELTRIKNSLYQYKEILTYPGYHHSELQELQEE